MTTSTALPAAHPAAAYLLALFRPDDLIAIMTLKDGKALHYFKTARDAASEEYLAELVKYNNTGNNIYVCMNPLNAKRRVKENVSAIRTAYLDLDTDGDACLDRILTSTSVPKPTFVLQSSPNKYQVIWHIEDMPVPEQESLLTSLITEFNADPAAKDAVRVLRLPGFKNHKYPEQPVVTLVTEPDIFETPVPYKRGDFRVTDSSNGNGTGSGISVKQPYRLPDTITEGSRNTDLHKFASSMRAKGCGEAEILAALEAVNLQRTDSPLPADELRTIASSVMKYPAGGTQEPTFPETLGKAALQGIVGDFVNLVLPHTEADVNCLTYQFVVAMGNVMGKNYYSPFGPERHYPGLYLMTIGTTSTGKGQGLQAVRAMARAIDQQWLLNRWKYSAASGEALVRLADNVDMRLMLTIPEMSILLNSMNREGSNLSGYLRAGYDGIPLENNKSKSDISAKDYLLSVIGQITPAELSGILSNVDFHSGVANRFLWNAVKRSKTLPRMSKVPDFTPLAERIQRLLKTDAEHHRWSPLNQGWKIDFSEAGAKLWDAWVLSLPENDDTRLGASQERIRPNALRTALIYAFLDESRLDFPAPDGKFAIEPQHVQAAIEIVTRSRASVEWFLNRPISITNDEQYEDVQKVRVAYNDAVSAGEQFTGTDLYHLLKHRTKSDREAIATAAGLTLTTATTTRHQGGGKPREVWTR